jgi:hypothetical protein
VVEYYAVEDCIKGMRRVLELQENREMGFERML